MAGGMTSGPAPTRPKPPKPPGALGTLTGLPGRVLGFLRGWLDRFQRRHRALAFGYAVVKKFGEDQAGSLAVVVTYYAFFALFPLLLVLVSVLGVVLHGHPQLQRQVLSSALGDFPVIGTQLRNNIGSLNRTGTSLAVGLAGTLLGARGVAGAAQNACNRLWGVPFTERPGFPFNQLRSLAWVAVVGTGTVVTTSVATFVAGFHNGNALLGPGLHAAAVAATALLNVGTFIGGFRLATAAVVRTRDLLWGAVLAGVGWTALQSVGAYVVNHQLKHASAVYGTFGLVIGLLSWLYLLAQLSVYAIEIDVVRTRRLWPRGLGAPLTPADRRALTGYARQQRRRAEEEVEIDFDAPGRGGRAGTTGAQAPPAEPASP